MTQTGLLLLGTHNKFINLWRVLNHRFQGFDMDVIPQRVDENGELVGLLINRFGLKE